MNSLIAGVGLQTLSIRSLMPLDSVQLLSLNASARPNVALLDNAELSRLQALSHTHIVAVRGENLLAYVLAFARDDAYDGEEFVTLRSLIPQPFIYIDQVVVHESVRGTGVGRRLYRALEHDALLRGARVLCCEVNIVPPNPGSLAFHAKLGFSTVGALATRDGRSVNLLHKRLTIAA